jgi:hypothetical protein
MDGPETTDTVRARRLGRIAVIAGITLVVWKLFAVGIFAVGICVGVFVILSPTMG